MKDDKGKVILSLLAGATAGIVAGLLLAPETGDETRRACAARPPNGAATSASWLKDTLAKAQGKPRRRCRPRPAVNENKAAADRCCKAWVAPPVSTAHTHNSDNPDYDGFGDDVRHRGPRRR